MNNSEYTCLELPYPFTLLYEAGYVHDEVFVETPKGSHGVLELIWAITGCPHWGEGAAVILYNGHTGESQTLIPWNYAPVSGNHRLALYRGGNTDEWCASWDEHTYACTAKSLGDFASSASTGTIWGQATGWPRQNDTGASYPERFENHRWSTGWFNVEDESFTPPFCVEYLNWGGSITWGWGCG